MMAEPQTRKTFSGSGRPRRSEVARYPSGQIVHRDRKPEETEEQILATTLAQPHRKPASDPRNPLLGYAVGRLRYTKMIDVDQYVALNRYGRVALRYMRDVTGTVPRFPSLAVERMDCGGGEGPDRADDDVFAIRRDWQDAMTALADVPDMHGVLRALASVCLLDRDPSDNETIGNVRIGANALHRLWSTKRGA